MRIHFKSLLFIIWLALGVCGTFAADLCGSIVFRNMLHKPSLENAWVHSVKIKLFKKINGQWIEEVNKEIITPPSGADLGKFCFRSLVPGQRYQVRFSKTGYVISTETNVNNILIKSAGNPVVQAFASRNMIGLYGLAALWAVGKPEVTSIDDPDSQVRGFDFVEATLGSPITNSERCVPPLDDLDGCVHPGNMQQVNGQITHDGFYKSLFEKVRTSPGFGRYLPITQMRLYSSDERRAVIPPINSVAEHQNSILTVLGVVNPMNPLLHEKMVIQLDEEILTTKYRTLTTPAVATPVLERNNQLAAWLVTESGGKLAVSQSYAPGSCNSFPGSAMHGVPANCQYMDPNNNYAAMAAHSLLVGAFGLNLTEFLRSLQSSKVMRQPAYVQIHFNPMRKPSTGAAPILDCKFWNDSFRLLAYQQIRAAFNQRVPMMLYWEALQSNAGTLTPAWGWTSLDQAAKDFKAQVLDVFVPTLQGKNPDFLGINHLPDAQTNEQVPGFMPRLNPKPESVCK